MTGGGRDGMWWDCWTLGVGEPDLRNENLTVFETGGDYGGEENDALMTRILLWTEVANSSGVRVTKESWKVK